MTESAIKTRVEKLKALVKDIREEVLKQRRENKTLREVVERLRTIEGSLRSGVQPTKRDPTLTCLVHQIRDLELINAKLLRDLAQAKRKLEERKEGKKRTEPATATKRTKPDYEIDDDLGPSTSKSSRGSMETRRY